MNISTSSLGLSSIQNPYATSSVGSAGTNSDGNNDGTSSTGSVKHHLHKGGGFGADVLQALSQMGINLSGQKDSSSTSSTSTDTSPTSTDNAGQALHTFMHDLFQALRSASNTSSGQNSGSTTSSGNDPFSTDISAVSKALQSGDLSGAQSAFATLQQDLQANAPQGMPPPPPAQARSSHAFGGLSNDLQSLIQSLSSGSSNSGSNDSLSKLQTDFQNLVQASGSSPTNSTSGSGYDLTTFLQNLSKNLDGSLSTNQHHGLFSAQA